MALRVFPDSLPAGYARYVSSPADATIRTPMEAGPDRVRRVSLDGHENVDVGWRFNGAEMELFRAWHADELRSDLGDSEDLLSWTNSNSTDSIQAAAGPDGDQATRIVENSVTASHYIYRSLAGYTTPDNGVYVIHATLKAAGRTWARVDLLDKSNVGVGAYIDLTTGALGSLTSGASASVKNRGAGWWRLSIEAPISTGATVPRVRIFSATANNVLSYLGNGASGVDVCELMGRSRTGFDLPAKVDGRGEIMGADGGSEFFLLRVSRGGSDEFVAARFVSQFTARALPGNNWDVTARLELADNV